MPSPRLQFRTIDLERDAELCIAFRRDSYVCSFGTDAAFVAGSETDGSGYVEWLRERIARFPEGHVHAWLGDEIVGQIEMIVGPGSGHVNLFYLRPDVRGRGLGAALHDYAVDLLQRGRVPVASLRVAPANLRAVEFYQRHGWVSRGTPSGEENEQLMELVVPAAPQADEI